MLAAKTIYLNDIKSIEKLVEHWTNSNDEVLLLVLDKNAELNTSDFEHFLSPDELVKAKKFRFDRDRSNFILGRGCLRSFIGQALKIDPRNVQLKFNKYGKPELEANPGLKFNVSHSEDIVILGFSKARLIGVDVERVKPFADLLKIAANYFSNSELDRLNLIPSEEQPRAFYRCWTRKESFIKAIGDGLSFPLDKFSVTLDEDLKARLIETSWDLSEKNRWDLGSFVPAPGYIAAYATRDF
ncbi:MAG: 4'-phosphopantetheinyl transferase superfamily protein [Flavobacteriaceae bacterium]